MQDFFNPLVCHNCIIPDPMENHRELTWQLQNGQDMAALEQQQQNLKVRLLVRYLLYTVSVCIYGDFPKWVIPKSPWVLNTLLNWVNFGWLGVPPMTWERGKRLQYILQVQTHVHMSPGSLVARFKCKIWEKRHLLVMLEERCVYSRITAKTKNSHA